MDKINGYPRSEAEELVRYVGEGRRMGKTLTSLFASYGKAHGRAGGSVRNYYYKLLKTKNAAPLLAGKNLRAETIVPFTDAETEEMLRSILSERKKGCSVRRAIANVCGGDAKKMLRYQNKYRNMLKNSRTRCVPPQKSGHNGRSFRFPPRQDGAAKAGGGGDQRAV